GGIVAAFSGSTGILRFSDSTALPAPPTPAHIRVAILNSNWDLFSATDAIMPPNTAMLGGVRELGGYDSLIHRDTDAMLKGVEGLDPSGHPIDPPPPANGNMMFVKPSALQSLQKLEDAGVSEVWSASAIENPPRGLIE